MSERETRSDRATVTGTADEGATTAAPAGDRVKPSPLGARYWKLFSASVISNLGDGVGVIAFPWLASAVTRSPVLIALLGAARMLPWLVFTLPAGVITDRVDRRRLMVWMDVFRALLVAAVAVTVLASRDLPSPAQVQSLLGAETNWPVYLVLLGSTLLLGFAEVLRDNSAQTFLPAIVSTDNLERANGQMWGAEMVANNFAGQVLGSILLGITFAVPFFFDAGTFAVAAGLVFLIGGEFKPRSKTEAQASDGGKIDWKGEIKEGFLWLWRHSLLRPMAIILGFLNGLGSMMFATFVLFAQEDLDLETGLGSGVLRRFAEFLGMDGSGTLAFAVLLMAGAIGGVLGMVFAGRISKALGSGPSLYLTLVISGVTALGTGTTSRWWVAFLMMAIGTFTAILWNVITVSLRQTIIPDELLGRVNSVYRFFGWGPMAVGSLLGGVVVAIGQTMVSRSEALRWPYFVVAAAYLPLFIYAAPRLTTQKIEGARAEALERREHEAADPTDADVAADAISEIGATGVPPLDEDRHDE